MIQYFQWYSRNDGHHYSRLRRMAPALARLGYTAVWLPPVYKGASGAQDVGYGVYDLYDLGEFRQKGSVRTKYGTADALLKAIDALHRKHIQVIADVVFNHRMGADYQQDVNVRTVDWNDRNRIISDTWTARLYTGFDFPGRKDKYSAFKWNDSCFKAADYGYGNDRRLLLFDGHQWSQNVSKECGNFDYIMGMDVDTDVPWVKKELSDWGKWFIFRTKADGFRMDSAKSIDALFLKDWVQEMRRTTSVSDFAVAEYWSGSLWELENWLDLTEGTMMLFDVPLHYNLHHASMSRGSYDVRRLYDGTLCQSRPDHAVAFVDNHDTQPTQALESWVEDWFKTSAYAFILLYRPKMPCVFLGDHNGIKKTGNAPVSMLDEMVWIRSHLLGQNIIDLFDDDPQKACWISLSDHPVIVIFTIGDAKSRTIQFDQLKNLSFTDVCRRDHRIQADSQGNLTVDCAPGCCSIYITDQDCRLMERKIHPRLKGLLTGRHGSIIK